MKRQRCLLKSLLKVSSLHFTPRPDPGGWAFQPSFHSPCRMELRDSLQRWYLNPCEFAEFSPFPSSSVSLNTVLCFRVTGDGRVAFQFSSVCVFFQVKLI